MKKLFYQCIVILSFCLISIAWPPRTVQGAVTIDARVQAILDNPAAIEAIPIIVTFRSGVNLSSLSTGPVPQRRTELVRTLKIRTATTQTSVREFLYEQGIEEIKDLWIINGLGITASPEIILALAAQPEVQSIRYDEIISLPPPEISTSQVTGPVESNIERVMAPQLWQRGFAGQGVTVAIIDSGVNLDHPDLGPRWRGGSNSWFDPNGEHPDFPVDVDGHGTGVAGVLIGGNTGGSITGVAPEAQWIAVKIFNDAGNASTSAIHQGFAWLLDPDGNPATDDAPDLVNSSWGFEEAVGTCDPGVRVFQADLQVLKAAGIAVVFAAGNTGPNSNTSVAPASYPESFAVGSVGTSLSTEDISTYSARGSSVCDGTVYPEVVAPGFSIRTAGLAANPFQQLTGTSFAAPHVSGVMALLLSAFPGASVETLERVLKESAADYGIAGADNTYGYGFINAETAFNLLNNPLLGILDSVAPQNDRVLPLGHIPVGTTATGTLTLRNDGGGFLFIQSAGIGDAPSPFSIAGNTCFQGLGSRASCTVTIRFTPTTHQSFTAKLDISSNSSASGVTSIELAGGGNTPPPAPQPTAPVNGATGLGGTVVLQWDQLPDADGDGVGHEVLLSTSPDFSQSTSIKVSSLTPAGGTAMLAGFGGFLVFFGVVGNNEKRRKRLMTGILLASALMLLLSCGGGGGGEGGGGGGGAGETPVVETMVESNTLELTALVTATTYYWKVTAEDAIGGRTESAVRTFTTR
jgi:bacillopeptidase F